MTNMTEDFCCPHCGCSLTWTYMDVDAYGTIREATCLNCGWDEKDDQQNDLGEIDT